MPKTTDLELTPEPSQALARRDENQALAVQRADPMAEIMGLFKMAVENKTDVSIVERMMVVRQQIRAEQAEEAFNAAMEAFQDECPIVKKQKSGAQGHYKYAELDDIVMQVKPLLKKYGFSYSIDSLVEEGWVTAKVKVKHRAGHSDVKEFKVPVDKRNTLMTLPQQYGGAMTFSKRYCFCNALGIMTADEDKDGAGGNRPKPKGPSTKEPASEDLRPLAAELWNLLAPVRGTKKDWVEANRWLWREDILDGAVPEEAPNLKADRFREAIEKAKAKLAK